MTSWGPVRQPDSGAWVGPAVLRTRIRITFEKPGPDSHPHHREAGSGSAGEDYLGVVEASNGPTPHPGDMEAHTGAVEATHRFVEAYRGGLSRSLSRSRGGLNASVADSYHVDEDLDAA